MEYVPLNNWERQFGNKYNKKPEIIITYLHTCNLVFHPNIRINSFLKGEKRKRRLNKCYPLRMTLSINLQLIDPQYHLNTSNVFIFYFSIEHRFLLPVPQLEFRLHLKHSNSKVWSKLKEGHSEFECFSCVSLTTKCYCLYRDFYIPTVHTYHGRNLRLTEQTAKQSNYTVKEVSTPF